MRHKIVFLTLSLFTLFSVGNGYEDEHKIPPCMQNHYASNYDYGSFDIHKPGYRTYSRPITKIISAPRPYPVMIRKVPTPVRYSVVRKRQPVHVHRPVSPKPITIEKPVFYKVFKKVFYPVKVPYKVPVVKKVVVKVPKPYPVLVDRPYPVKVPKPIIVEKKVPVYINIGDSHDDFKSSYEAGLSGFGAHSSQSNAVTHSSLGSSHKYNNNGDESLYTGKPIKQYGQDNLVRFPKYDTSAFHVSSGQGLNGYSGSNSLNKFAGFGESNSIIKNLASGSHTSSSGNANKYIEKQLSSGVNHVSLGEHASQSVSDEYSGHGLSSSLSNLQFGHDISSGYSGNSFKSDFSDKITTKPSLHQSSSSQYLKHGLGTKYTDISTEQLGHVVQGGNSDKTASSGYSGHGSSSGFTGKTVYNGISGHDSSSDGHSNNILSNGFFGQNSFGGHSKNQLSNAYLGHSSVGSFSDTLASNDFSVHENTGSSIKSASDLSGYSSGGHIGGFYDNKVSNGYSGHGTSNLHSSSQGSIGYLGSSSGKHGTSNKYSGKKLTSGFSGYVPGNKVFSGFVDVGHVNGHSSIKSTGSSHNIENSDAHYFNGFSEYTPSKNYPIDEVSSEFYGSDNSFVGGSHSNEDSYFDLGISNEYGRSSNGSDYPQYGHSSQSSGYEHGNQKKSKEYFTAKEIASHFSESDASTGVLSNGHSTGYGTNELASGYLSNGHTSGYDDEDYSIGQSDYVNPHSDKRSKCDQ